MISPTPSPASPGSLPLGDATAAIRAHLRRMDALYGRPVFDEWAILGLAATGQATVLAYEGPRAASFAHEVASDTRALRAACAARTYEIGDFEFAHEAPGAHLDAFIRIGPATYLVGNHTEGTMNDIRSDVRWRQAQAAWFDLAEKFRAAPLA